MSQHLSIKVQDSVVDALQEAADSRRISLNELCEVALFSALIKMGHAEFVGYGTDDPAIEVYRKLDS